MQGLLAEVDAALSSNRWSILPHTEHALWLLYDAAALRHCCRLLDELGTAVLADQDLMVRILGRTHTEAWLTASYIHVGGYEAVTRIAQNTRQQIQAIGEEASQFNEQLARQKKKARRLLRNFIKDNKGIAQWNAAHPDRPIAQREDEPVRPATVTHQQLSYGPGR